jgi:hypothetical protein
MMDDQVIYKMGIVAFQHAQLELVLRGLLNNLVRGHGFSTITAGESASWLIQRSQWVVKEVVRDQATTEYLLFVLSLCKAVSEERNRVLHDALMAAEPGSTGIERVRSRRGRGDFEVTVAPRAELDRTVERLKLAVLLIVRALPEIGVGHRTSTAPDKNELWADIDAGAYTAIGVPPRNAN